MPDARNIPPATRRIIESWAAGNVGALTGFTGALVRNDLRAAVNLADAPNFAALPATLAWMWDAIPEECWGSPEAVTAWKARHLG